MSIAVVVRMKIYMIESRVQMMHLLRARRASCRVIRRLWEHTGSARGSEIEGYVEDAFRQLVVSARLAGS